MIKKIDVGKLEVEIFESRDSMGRNAVSDIEDAVVRLLEQKEYITIVFAAAPSQIEVLDGLRKSSVIEWSRVIALHMDEYVGLDYGSPQLFGEFLNRYVFKGCGFKSVHYMDGMALDLSAECNRYTQFLINNKPDITLMGIGENGHIAFNDPAVADFNDTEMVKVVTLDQICRQQQVNDECFDTIDDVPKLALTLTIPALLLAEHVFCVVPNERKKQAVTNTLRGVIDEICPASILRRKKGAKMYLDKDSGHDML